MIDSHEFLIGRVYGLVKEHEVSRGSLPMQPSWQKVASKRKRITSEDGEINISVGIGGRRNWIGRIASGAERVTWVTDYSSSPPLTRLIVETVLGAHTAIASAVHNDTEPDLLHSVYSDEGSAIVSGMHGLLDQAGVSKKPDELTSTALPYATVPGLGL